MDNIEVILYNKSDLNKYIKGNCNSLILFLGAGFTKDAKNKKNKRLPDGKELKEYFINEILSYNKHLSKDELKKESLANISELFFELCDEKKVRDYFSENFTNIKLSSLKKDFLVKIKWKNIYTLNIDDSLEKATGYNKLLPTSEKLDKEMLSKLSPFIIKLHGDVTENLIKNKNLKNQIVFTKSTYIRQLMQKNEVYDVFLDNYKDYNAIFIGVSFDDEIDLEGFIDNEIQNLSISLNRIYITDQKPDLLKKMKLKKLGINKIFVINDYNEFYEDMIKICTESNEENDAFKFFELTTKTIEDKNKNILFLLGEKNIDLRQNKIFIPKFLIERNINYQINEKVSYTEFIIKYFERENFFIINGKRFSGKTYFLTFLYKNIKNIKKIFIPSFYALDLDLFKQILLEDNLLIILDTNSYDNKIIQYAYDLKKELIDRNIKIIFTLNENDILESMFFKWKNIKEFSLKNRFDDKEINDLNKKLDSMGIIKFKNNKTIIDYIFSVYNKYYKDKRKYSNINFEIKSIISKFDNLDGNKRKIIFGTAVILLIENKIYSSVFYRLYKKAEYFEKLNEFFEFIIEKEKTFFEKEQSSGFKYTLECNSCLYYFMKFIIDNKKITFDEIVNIVVVLIKKLYNSKHRNIAIKLINFNNLNFLFSYQNTGGARRIIYNIYEQLNELLNNNIDYWIQRAKSILHLSANNGKEIRNGIDYALKAYVDADKEKKKRHAIFTLALLYGKLTQAISFTDENIMIEAIDWYYKAFSDEKNQRYIDYYIKNIKNKTYKSDLFKLIEEVGRFSLSKDIEYKKNFLFNKLVNNE